MTKSTTKSHDELMSHLIAALHASQSLHMGMIERLVRMSLIELGQSIVKPQTQKPRKKKPPMRQEPAAVSRKLASVTELVRDTPDASIPRRNDLDMLQRRSGHPPIPRRRLPPRRTGSRG